MRPTSSKHRIKQQHPTIRNILRQLIIEQLGLARLLVPLDEDLTNPDGAAAVPQSLLHSLAGSHDGNATDLALEHDARVRPSDGRGDDMLDDGEVVQAFLDE